MVQLVVKSRGIAHQFLAGLKPCVSDTERFLGLLCKNPNLRYWNLLGKVKKCLHIVFGLPLTMFSFVIGV